VQDAAHHVPGLVRRLGVNVGDGGGERAALGAALALVDQVGVPSAGAGGAAHGHHGDRVVDEDQALGAVGRTGALVLGHLLQMVGGVDQGAKVAVDGRGGRRRPDVAQQGTAAAAEIGDGLEKRRIRIHVRIGVLAYGDAGVRLLGVK